MRRVWTDLERDDAGGAMCPLCGVAPGSREQFEASLRIVTERFSDVVLDEPGTDHHETFEAWWWKVECAVGDHVILTAADFIEDPSSEDPIPFDARMLSEVGCTVRNLYDGEKRWIPSSDDAELRRNLLGRSVDVTIPTAEPPHSAGAAGWCAAIERATTNVPTLLVLDYGLAYPIDGAAIEVDERSGTRSSLRCRRCGRMDTSEVMTGGTCRDAGAAKRGEPDPPHDLVPSGEPLAPEHPSRAVVTAPDGSTKYVRENKSTKSVEYLEEWR